MFYLPLWHNRLQTANTCTSYRLHHQVSGSDINEEGAVCCRPSEDKYALRMDKYNNERDVFWESGQQKQLKSVNNHFRKKPKLGFILLFSCMDVNVSWLKQTAASYLEKRKVV